MRSSLWDLNSFLNHITDCLYRLTLALTAAHLKRSPLQIITYQPSLPCTNIGIIEAKAVVFDPESGEKIGAAPITDFGKVHHTLM